MDNRIMEERRQVQDSYNDRMSSFDTLATDVSETIQGFAKVHLLGRATRRGLLKPIGEGRWRRYVLALVWF